MNSLSHFKPIKISKPAKSDLNIIADYTLREWGELQKKIYIDLFRQFFRSLSQNDDSVVALLKERNEISSGLLSYEVKSHIVYFRVKNQEILILRILHSRMDPNRHLHD